MSDVFVSHVEEDADIALEIALGLEEAGYATWCYELDSIPGASYLIQTGQAVEAAKAIIVVVSPNSLGSRQVTSEVIRAHETNTEFLPILRGISHAEFQARQPEWREAAAAASSTPLPQEGVAPILPRIVSGLELLGITPSISPNTAKIQQLRQVIDNIREHGTPVKPITPGARSVTSSILAGKTGQGIGGRKKWIKPALITVATAVVAVTGFMAFQKIIMPDPTQTTEVKTQQPVTTETAEIETQQPITEFVDEPREDEKDYPEDSTILPAPEVTNKERVPVPVVVNIPDENLRAAINGMLGKSPNEDITNTELARISHLNAERRGITDLTGVEYLVNLTSISFGDNPISDISPLSSLTKLSQIYSWHNQISDISPLSSLTNLNRLALGDNQISDISALSSLTKLVVLEMSMNQVSDLSPLSSCTSLVELEIEGNLVSDISILSSLPNLSLLDLRENQVSDISALSSLTKLAVLELGRNQVSDISTLSSLENLTVLDLEDNLIRNISPFFSLTKLTVLTLDSNQIRSVKPLSSLINLNELGLRWNQVADIQPLVENSGLSDWDVLYLAGNPLSAESLNTFIPQLEERGVEVSFEEGYR